VNGSEKIVPLAAQPKDARATNAGYDLPEQRDWSGSLELVRRAGFALRGAEEQTHKLVERAEAILERANRELESAYDSIATAEAGTQAAEARAERAEARLKVIEPAAKLADARAKAAEARAQIAESRAKSAEEWLQRIHETIVSEFPALGSSLADEGLTIDRRVSGSDSAGVVSLRQSADVRKMSVG
jgi:hypothetical protein